MYTHQKHQNIHKNLQKTYGEVEWKANNVCKALFQIIFQVTVTPCFIIIAIMSGNI